MKYVSRCSSSFTAMQGMLMLCIVIAGCVTSQSRRYPMSDGWRMGWITSVQQAVQIPDRTKNSSCPTSLNDNADIATVAYSTLRGMHYKLVQIPANLNVKIGDKVAVNIEDCSKAMALVKS